jgi:hypothetical protein
MNRVPAGVKEEFEKRDGLSENIEFSEKEHKAEGSSKCASLKVEHEFKDFLYWNYGGMSVIAVSILDVLLTECQLK